MSRFLSFCLFALLTVASGRVSADEAPEAPGPTDTLPPKVAVVIAGDPDERIRDIAGKVQTECVDAGLRTPADPALRAALIGGPGTADDGLSGVRSVRRSLGVNPRKDLGSYKRLGSITGADALVVLRREGTVKLEVFDVSAAQFYEGMLDTATTTPTERGEYIELRAKTAQARWTEPPIVVAEPPEASAVSVAVGTAEVTPVDEPAKKKWIKKAWPYFIVGALLVGGVTYIIVDQRRTNDPGPPLLRFRPGDE
ncbi:MAG: hypothetical protein AAF436_07520 [Myxococcota bacterium]